MRMCIYIRIYTLLVYLRYVCKDHIHIEKVIDLHELQYERSIVSTDNVSRLTATLGFARRVAIFGTCSEEFW